MSSLQTLRYRELAARLQQQIERGELCAGARLPSFVQMRNEGVSQHTMEKAYTLLESEGFIERLSGSGIYVRQAQPVAVTIGICGVGAPQHESHGGHLYGMQILTGAQEVAQKRGVSLMMLGADTKSAAWEKVDGALLISQTDDILDRLPPAIQSVLLLRPSQRVASVCADDEGGAYEATRHLLELGHRRIGVLHVGWDEWSKRRLKGYHAALNECGVAADERWIHRVHGDETSPYYPEFASRRFNFFRDGRERTEEWLARDWDELGLTALLAHNDQTALGALAALREAGRRVPDDVSVIGFDGTEAAEHAHPRLTTVEVPLSEIGARGVETLLDLLRDEASKPSSVMLETKLQLGGSTASPRSIF